ncbi:VWA domain-containing protein [Vulcanisaeta sp. JCM 14467]|uniref:VWA domain-containing protein n=1 Tax=Vulcanisaeta sp. JCM 14467 TaxID=1295370 RepID=UPI000AF47CA6|nr:VWA domain-containing protein [Vulcanisaeta sp. JCM 14467]
MAEANRNILYIDEVNLLDDYIVDVLLDAAAYGWNTVEREGVSVRHPARFILVASMNPEEGELRPQLLDRFGLVVDVEAPQDPEVRAEIVRRVEEFNRDPEGFYKRWEPEVIKLRERIERAMELVKDVEVPDDLLRLLADTVVKLGIRTSRAEVVTVRTAKALAALDGRMRVTMEDLQRAMELALPHRLRARPFEKPRASLPQQQQNQQPQPQQAPRQNPQQPQGGRQSAEQRQGKQGSGGLNEAQGLQQWQGGHGDLNAGKEVHGPSEVNVAVKFTKGRATESRGLSSRAAVRRVVGIPMGVPYMYLPADGREPGDVDIVGTIVTAALRGHLPRIGLDDLTVRVRRARAPRVSLILLDASGSMNFMRRIEVAKGIVQRIAEESYVRRSYVGLISFRGAGVDRVINPTRNYWRVIEELSELPSGGATPLSAALAYAVDLIKGLRLRLRGDYWVYVITDGKANVSLTGDVRSEIEIYMSELSRLARIVVYDARPTLIYDPSMTYMDVLSRYAVDTVRLGYDGL